MPDTVFIHFTADVRSSAILRSSLHAIYHMDYRLIAIHWTYSWTLRLFCSLFLQVLFHHFSTSSQLLSAFECTQYLSILYHIITVSQGTDVFTWLRKMTVAERWRELMNTRMTPCLAKCFLSCGMLQYCSGIHLTASTVSSDDRRRRTDFAEASDATRTVFNTFNTFTAMCFQSLTATKTKKHFS